MSSINEITLKKDSVLCLEGDTDNSLYIVKSGKLMVCVKKGTQVIPLAYLGANTYLGELSFFDEQPRSANIIALEETEILRLPPAELKSRFPQWLLDIALQLTKKTRLVDEVIKGRGLKKKNLESIKPLSIDEQRHYLTILDPK